MMGDDAPFRTKGMLYLGVRDFCARRVPGGLDALAQRLPGDLGRFWRQIFIASGSYDVLPLVGITRVAAELAETDHRDLVRENARFIAHRDIHGVYRLLLKVVSPKQVALRLPKVSMRYFDFGSAEGELLGDDAFLGRQRGVPSVFVDFMIWAVEGFASVALETAGAKQVRVQVQDQRREGEVAGIETCTLTWLMEWNG